MEEERTKNRKDGDEIHLIDLLIVLAKHKKLIFSVATGIVVATALISLIMTPVYKAETKIYIPQSTAPNFAAQLLNQISPFASLMGGAQTPNPLYIELLKSRHVCDHIIDRFGLMKLYQCDSREQTQRDLIDHIDAREDIKSGIIILDVEDGSPRRAAAMANAFIEEFRNLKKNLSLIEASQRRVFFEEQLKETKDTLVKSEEAMRGFQEKTGVLKIDEQATAVIEGIAQIKAQIAAKEIERNVMLTYSTPQNPDVRRVDEELRGMREQMERLESKSSGNSVIVPTGNIPSMSTEYMRRMRDLKFNETLYELLQGQYQSAKFDEVRDSMVVQVIENAVPPETRSKPQRTLMVILAAIAGLFLSICMAFLWEYKEREMTSPENDLRVKTLKRYLSFRRKS